MSEQFTPRAGAYTEAQLAQMHADAVARGRAKAAEKVRASRPGYVTPPSGYGQPPIRESAHQVPTFVPEGPVRVPTGAIRVPRSTQPVSTPTPAQPRAQRQEVIRSDARAVDVPSSISETDAKKKPYILYGVATVAALGATLYAANQMGVIGSEGLSNIAQASISHGSGSQEGSIYGEIQLPSKASAEGLNIENCKRPGAAIATIRVTGYYAIRYQVNTSDGDAVAVPRPYMMAGDLSKGENDDPKNAKFETKSGYPEMTIHDVSLEVFACAKPNTAAISQVEGVDTINVANIDFSVLPAVPAEQENEIQTEAYMSKVGPNAVYTWPAQTFLAKNPEKYTDASVDAVNAAHAKQEQQLGVFNAAIQSIIANASDADINSEFNQSVVFAQKDVDSVYTAIKKGLEVRVGSKPSGAISGLTPILSEHKPERVDTSAAPKESFEVVEGEVIVGSYVDDPRGRD